MHKDRIELTKQYNAALTHLRIAEMGSDERVYLDADATVSALRKRLVEIETAYPTKEETRRRLERLKLANRGLDV